MPTNALAQAAAPARPAAQHDATPTTVGEILVTAQRRAERLTDIPYNISAVTSASLENSGTTNANDIGKVVAGLNTVNQGPASVVGQNGFSLRGLRTDAAGLTNYPANTVNTVSTYFGDSPLFFSIMLNDLQRIEILRGPQGTLYGSGAEGGTIRFIPNRPSFDKVGGELNASTGKTYNSREMNGSVDGVVNIPLADTLALRLVGAYNRQAGYIDEVDLLARGANNVPVPANPAAGIFSGPALAPIQRGTNNSYQAMVRGALRWDPTSWLDTELTVIHQKTHADDQQYTNPFYPAGRTENSSFQPQTGVTLFPAGAYATRGGGKLRNTSPQLDPVDATLDLVSGSIDADLGFAHLQSITTQARARTTSSRDTGAAYYVGTRTPGSLGPFFYVPLYYIGYPDWSAPGTSEAVNKGFTEEIRLVSKSDQPLTYVLGAYYEKRHVNFTTINVIPGLFAYANAVAPTAFYWLSHPVSPFQDTAYNVYRQSTFTTKAVFGELTWHVNDQWQVTGGVRAFQDEFAINNDSYVPFFNASPSNPLGRGLNTAGVPGSVQASQKVSKTAFKANTSYDIMKDTKVYFTFAQGFRRGGTNGIFRSGPFVQMEKYANYQPDFADNYEVGIKGLALDRTLTYTVALFDIELKDAQVEGFSPAQITTVYNAKLARSKGFEAEFTYRPTRDLTLSAAYTYTDAKIAETTVLTDYAFSTSNVVVAQTFKAGAKLPGVSRDTAVAAVDYRIPLANEAAVILHLNANYRSSQTNLLDMSSYNAAIIPKTSSADARITYDSGKQWTAAVFVNNLTNSIGYTGAAGVQTPNLFQQWFVSTPRTIGADIHYEF